MEQGKLIAYYSANFPSLPRPDASILSDYRDKIGNENYEILLQLKFQEAKERDIEFDQESGYSSNSPNSSPSSEIFGSRDESSRDASSSTTTETSLGREASQSPRPSSSCSSSTTSSPIAVMKTLQTPTLATRSTTLTTQGAQIVEVKKRPIFGTIQTKNGPVVIKAVLPAGTLAKKSLVFKQAAQSILWRNVKFSVKYFGKEVRSWSFREKAMCRLTSEKKPMDVKYPNPIYNEKKMFKVGCST